LTDHLNTVDTEEDVETDESDDTTTNISENETDTEREINNIPVSQNGLQDYYFNVIITSTNIISNESLFNSNIETNNNEDEEDEEDEEEELDSIS